MHSDPAAAANTESSNFSLPSQDRRFQPNASFPTGSFSLYSIFCERADNDFFQVAQVFANICSKFFQVQDRITDNLFGSVKGYITPTVCLDKKYPAFL